VGDCAVSTEDQCASICFELSGENPMDASPSTTSSSSFVDFDDRLFHSYEE